MGFWPPPRRRTIAIGIILTITTIAVLTPAHIIRNELHRWPPIDRHDEAHWGEGVSGVWVWGDSFHHAYVDSIVDGCNCARARLYTYCHIGSIWPQPSTTVVANAWAEMEFLEFECRHTSTYDIHIGGDLAANAVVYVPSPPGAWGGADAEYNIYVTWRIRDEMTDEVVAEQTEHVHGAWTQHANPAVWLSGDPSTPAYWGLGWVFEDVELQDGNSYRSELLLSVDSNVTTVGSSGGATANVIIDPHNGQFGDQLYDCSQCGFELVGVIFIDNDPDYQPPVTFIHPPTLDHCAPITVTLAAEDEAGGYGVEAIHYRIDAGDWSIYSTPFPVNDDATVAYYSVDWAGNEDEVRTISYRILEIPTATLPTATPGCDVIALSWQPVTDADEYCIYRDGMLMGCTTELAWQDTAPGPGVRCYAISGRNTCGEGGLSETACTEALTEPEAPLLVGVPDGALQVPQPVTLEWDAVAGGENYRLQVDDDPGFGSPEVDVELEATEHELGELAEATTYTWRVAAEGACGWGGWSEIWTFTTEFATDVPPAIPDHFGLAQNYPNPFNPATTIQLDLPEERPVALDIWSFDGHHVRKLIDGVLPGGTHPVVWNGRDDEGRRVASGTYIYTVRAGADRATRRMTLIK